MVDSVFLLLGSNLGNRMSFLRQAEEELERAEINVLKKSSVYLTESWGYDDNPYLNCVLWCRTVLSPYDLLKTTQLIEKKLGRKREKKGYQARTIDIDILFYDKEIIKTEFLMIPHPLIQERRFVLKPFCEICPDFMHPLLKQNVKTLLSKCKDNLQVNLYSK